MKPFLLLLAALAAAQAQSTQSTPPHVLFVPRTYHVGTTERVSFISYGLQQFEVTAQVSYDDCVCQNFRRCSNRGGVFHTARGLTRQGRPTPLLVEMPGHDDLQGRNYYISVTSHNGSVVYLSRRSIRFSSSAFGFLLVKTDKPIYKPEQQVNFCIVYVDKSLRPFDSTVTATVTVRDGRFKQILKRDSVAIEPREFTCLDFPLSEEPNFGTWRIQASIKIPDEEGGCRVFYSTPSATCTFKVEEFVLPRFEVTLEVPKQLTREEDFILGTVSAKYTFGENVQGTVRLNATLTSSRRRETLPFFDMTTELNDGKYNFRISADDYRALVRYRYDPFCVSSRIQIVAEVREAGRGTPQASSASFSLVANPVTVKFSDDNRKHFRPGLNYTVKAQVTLADGSPANGADVRLTATINNNQRVLYDQPVTSNQADGSITLPIPVPRDANCLKITLSPVEEFPACETQQVCFSPSPFFSPTKSFLQLEDISRRKPLRVGDRADILATSTVPFEFIQLLVIGQGDIQHHSYKIARGESSSTMLQFRVSTFMVPKVKVLAVFARRDGELVADLIELPVDCALQNKVAVSFNQSNASPGDPISVSVATSNQSMVLLSVIDKSLTLLADACRSLEQNNICRLLLGLTSGSLSGGSKCDSDTSDACCPSSCSEPTKYAVGTIFSAAGVSIQSNMFQPSPPVTRRPDPFPFPYPYFEDGIQFDAVPGRPGPADIRRPVPAPLPEPEDINEVDPEGGEESGARTFFPESWIWTLLRTDHTGAVTTNSTVPDTITTWVAEAFSLGPSQGLGLSPLTELTVTKPFFVSLELPFSINFGETVVINPLVLYFGTKRRVRATITVVVDDELDLVENSLPSDKPLVVQRKSSEHFSLKLHPRAIGQLAITITAVGDQGQRDVVRKFLLVKPGCEKFEITQNVFAEGSGSQCFNYTLPSCVIPGSAKASISVTGDVMSPPNLDRLLVLPSGCGEQNLVKTATNWVVAEYLVATRQLSDFIAVKIRNNIQRGYQRQLTYLQSSGCFSIWSTGSCSLWLTAAVVNSFTGIVSFYREQEPGQEIVDQAVITGALNYVLNNQEKSGRLPIVGRVHNFGLVDDIGHTAFGLLALKSYVDTFKDDSSASSTLRRARTAISNAEEYLLSQYNETGDLCNYGLALSAYAILRSQERPPEKLSQILDDLRARVTNSKTYPGACYLCNGCPRDEGSTADQGTDCIGRPRSEGSAACVETTAYALLALLEGGDTRYTVCLAQWLVRIRSGSGGYWSSQDTVVALQALAKFAESTYSQTIDKTIVFSLPDISSPVTRTITTGNRFERFDVEVPSVPSVGNCVRWSGNGTAILQSTVEYHGCNCCGDTRAFSLELASTRESSPLGDIVQLSIRVRYLQGKSSNMAIVDVEIPSGFIYGDWTFPDEFARNVEVERVDARGSNVVFYLNDVPSRAAATIVITFIERFPVESPMQLPVTIYDYYDPGQTVTKYYLPETSRPLPRTTATPPIDYEFE